MPTTIKLKVEVAELDNVLSLFDQIKVFRSDTGIAGVYTEITNAAPALPARLALLAGKALYEFDDTLGEITSYYRVSYLNSTTLAESNQSAPRLGDDPATNNIMTVAELKDIYLFGLDLTNDAGEPFPDLMFEWGIRWAIGIVERQLDILVRPTVFVDQRYDYYRGDYLYWTIINLRENPVISVEGVAVTWPSNTVVIDFPKDWIQLRPDSGQINIVPTSGTLSQVLFTAGGSFLPLVASGRDFVPNILSANYTAGFAEGQVPVEIRDLIGKYATFPSLNVAGDLIVGAGIASKSISLDGLSQSINTTSSATNAGYGARLLQYSREIKEVVPMLRRYYKRLNLVALG
jgi:hypothetical protein